MTVVINTRISEPIVDDRWCGTEGLQRARNSPGSSFEPPTVQFNFRGVFGFWGIATHRLQWVENPKVWGIGGFGLPSCHFVVHSDFVRREPLSILLPFLPSEALSLWSSYTCVINIGFLERGMVALHYISAYIRTRFIRTSWLVGWLSEVADGLALDVNWHGHCQHNISQPATSSFTATNMARWILLSAPIGFDFSSPYY